MSLNMKEDYEQLRLELEEARDKIAILEGLLKDARDIFDEINGSVGEAAKKGLY